MNVAVQARHRLQVTVCAILLIVLTAVGCANGTSAANPSPLGVEVVEVQQKDVPIYSEWIGTLDGLVNADIKAQVSGYLLKQDYTEGSFVQKGQLLFEIDPRPFQAGARSGPGSARAGQRGSSASQGATGTGGGAGCGRRGQSAQSPARRGPLRAAGQTAGHHPAGPRQRHAEQPGREGPGAGGEGQSGNRAGTDSGRQCRRAKRPRPRSKPRSSISASRG